MPRRGSLKLRGSMGTGLAQPKTTGDFIRISMAGSRMVPKGSM
jgi:hypothetical protein